MQAVQVIKENYDLYSLHALSYQAVCGPYVSSDSARKTHMAKLVEKCTQIRGKGCHEYVLAWSEKFKNTIVI